jgi:hypothetical protein
MHFLLISELTRVEGIAISAVRVQAFNECDNMVILAKRALGAVAALQRYLRGGS